MNVSFPPKVITSSRKPYRCFTCLCTISTGTMYVRHAVKDGKAVKDASVLKEGDTLVTMLHRGKVESMVQNK